MISHLFQQCTICKKSGEILCTACQRHLNIYKHNAHDDNSSILTGMIVGRHYDRIIRHLVHRLKYGRGRAVANILGAKLATLIHTSDLIQDINSNLDQVIITAVPTHWIKRYITRGYNQAQLLAQSIAQNLKLPYTSLLTKSRRTSSQVSVSRSHRLTNIINSFGSISPHTLTHQNNKMGPKIIIIVDDIVTTGATMGECARVLHQNYPHAKVWGVCIARNT